MDSVQIGNAIKELRKAKGLTQLQLAEKLNITDKAVSRWELGQAIPDIQQLEAIVKLFNISYDDLIGGNIEHIKLSSNKESNFQKKISRKFDSKEWYSLDNAAKIYPPSASKNWNRVFRIAAIMKESIDEPILNQALADMVDRFPTIMVTLKKGLFWYYFNRMEKPPKVTIGGNRPCINMPLDGKQYLFRVSIENSRIACDFFHSLTDGTGGSIFLNTLLTRYYELKYGAVEDYKGALNVLDKPKDSELDDSFARYCQKGNCTKRKVHKVYQIHAGKIKMPQVTHVVINAQQLKDLAHKFGCTITVLLTAIQISAYLKRKKYDRDNLPVKIQIPINVRKYFASDTLRNFALFTGIEIKDENLSLEEIIPLVAEQLKQGTERETVQGDINANMRDENNPAVRIIPLFLKNIGLSIANILFGDRGFSSTFSNVGVMSCPKELNAIVDRMEFVLKESVTGGLLMSAITFNNKCTISFIRNVNTNDIEREFVRTLTKLGLEIYIESNIGDDNENM